MHYKTITLELLQQHMHLYDRHLKNRTLLTALDFYASKLKEAHLAWKERLSEAAPDSSESQIASEAMELALMELEGCLASECPPDENEELSLDGAMAFILGHHMQPA
jgi:hypothetical protein